jgi:hypothetical protein
MPFAAGPRAGFVHPRATVIASSPSRRGVFTFGHINGGPSFNTRGNLEFHHHHFRHSFFFAEPFFGYSAFDPFYDNYWNPYSFGPYGYDPNAGMSTYNDLSGEVGNLSSQVQQLQNENDTLQAELDEDRQPPPAPAASSSGLTSSGPPTVLVYNDGHQIQVQNYAIVGQTLWILSDNRASKVPLADLDLKQTIKVNEDRGVEFLGPASITPKQ